MKSPEATACRVLVDKVRGSVLPALTAAGFSALDLPAESSPAWHLHRARVDGGYDVISIIFDKKHRPRFYGMINVISAKGLIDPWGKHTAASQACAVSPSERVLILKPRRGLLAMILPHWFGHGSFGFEPSGGSDHHLTEATRVCAEFLQSLSQAESWWADQKMGPNLISAKVVLVPKQNG